MGDFFTFISARSDLASVSMSEHTRTPRQSREFTRIHCPDRIVWIFFRDTHHFPSAPPLIRRANPLVLSHPAGLLVYHPRPRPPPCTIPPHQLSHHPRDNRNFKLKGPIFVHLDAVCCVVGFTNPPARVAPRAASPILIPHRFPNGHQRYPLLLRCDKVDVQTIVLVEGMLVLSSRLFQGPHCRA